MDNNSGFDKDETFYIETYGCQMNFSDSNDIRKLLIENGYKESPKLEKADIIVVNTCSVRETAEQRIHGRLSFLKKLKSIDDKILILNGCMAERLSDRLLYDFPDLDIVVGTHNKSKIAEVIKHYKSKKIKKAYTGFNGYVFSKAKADYKYPYKAFIPIIHALYGYL